MDSFALIVHPSVKQDDQGAEEGSPEEHGLRNDPVLMRHRTFNIDDLQLVVEQTWVTAKEKEW